MPDPDDMQDDDVLAGMFLCMCCYGALLWAVVALVAWWVIA